MSAANERVEMNVLVYDWFSYSHWGMFRLKLFSCPDWFADGLAACDGNLDDDLYEDIE